MTTPHVTELPLRLEAVTADPFIERLVDERARRSERERRLHRVRDLLRKSPRNRVAPVATERA